MKKVCPKEQLVKSILKSKIGSKKDKPIPTSLDDPNWGVCRGTCTDDEVNECTCKPI
jgi:hypothetical protein